MKTFTIKTGNRVTLRDGAGRSPKHVTLLRDTTFEVSDIRVDPLGHHTEEDLEGFEEAGFFAFHVEGFEGHGMAPHTGLLVAHMTRVLTLA
jgi:hypothetical protein